jgi:hypothetical protein
MAVAFPAVVVINAQSRADRCPQLEQLNFPPISSLLDQMAAQ